MGSSGPPSTATPSTNPVKQPLAATIPPELLMQIFDSVDEAVLAADQSALFESQSERLRQSLVCRSWFAARIRPDEFILNTNEQAKNLLDTFQKDRARAGRVQMIYFEFVTENVASLLSLCSSVVEVSILSRGPFPHDAIAALPVSVRKLALLFTPADSQDWIPRLEGLNANVQLHVSALWSSRRAVNTRRVLNAIAPVLGQIVDLTLHHRPSAERGTRRGFLEAIIPELTALKRLDVSLYQVRPGRLARAIAQLDKLVQLNIVYVDDKDGDERFTSTMLAGALNEAQDSLSMVSVDKRLLLLQSPRDWLTHAVKLFKAAADNEIQLIIEPSENDHKYLMDEDESESDGWETASSDADENEE